jgi:hypothetical protein
VSPWVSLHFVHHSWIAGFHHLKLFQEHSVRLLPITAHHL